MWHRMKGLSDWHTYRCSIYWALIADSWKRRRRRRQWQMEYDVRNKTLFHYLFHLLLLLSLCAYNSHIRSIPTPYLNSIDWFFSFVHSSKSRLLTDVFLHSVLRFFLLSFNASLGILKLHWITFFCSSGIKFHFHSYFQSASQPFLFRQPASSFFPHSYGRLLSLIKADLFIANTIKKMKDLSRR